MFSAQEGGGAEAWEALIAAGQLADLLVDSDPYFGCAVMSIRS